MSVIKIPDSAEEVVEQLGHTGEAIARLTQLLTARQWQRAALVACLVGPERGKGRPRKSLTIETFPYSTVRLADLGIQGLRSSTTVAKYRNIWVRERPIPDFGDEVDLDGLPEWTGEVRSYVTGRMGTPALRTEPTHRPGPGEEGYDVEGAAYQTAKIDGTLSLRAVREEEDEPVVSFSEDVTVRVNNKDGAHIDVGIALQRLKDARRKRDEDYPTLNAYQKFGVRGNLGQIKELIEELWPNINEAEEEVMRKRQQESG